MSFSSRSDAPPATAAASPVPAATLFCFSVLAAAEPGIMPRVLELFAKRNLVPNRWHSDLLGQHNEDLSIDLQVGGLTADRAAYIARCLRQIQGVERVLLSEKPPA